MDEDIILEVETSENPAIFGLIADQEAGRFSYGTFAEFLANRQKEPIPPVKPNAPICYENNPEKQRVFTEVGQRLKIAYQNHHRTYETKKKAHETLNEYPPSLVGYAGYIQSHHPQAVPFLFRRHTIPVGENHRQKHTYITGGSGSGKTEVIKSFVWHYLTRNPYTGLVLIDPHGTLSEQVARFKQNTSNGRLIYIDPAIDQKHFPCLNPFDIEGKEDMTDIEAENYGEEFRIVFGEILKGDFTEQMNTILIYTLPVMMKYPNASIFDLLAFLEVDGGKVAEYIAFAEKRFKNRSLVEFLAGQYENDRSYKQTRNSLQTRLRAIFSSTILQAVFSGKRTLNLAEEMNARKLIVFNLSKGKMPRESGIIGKFIIASLKIIALQREKIPENRRVSCHLFIDEYQNFVTSSIDEILKEARKYRLHLTLAQQIAGDGMNDDFFKTIKANTAVKLTGANGDDTLKIMAKETGAEMEALKNLSTGKFSLWKRPDVGETPHPPYVVKMPSNTIGEKQSMTAEQWQHTQREQIRGYYRPIATMSDPIHPTREETPENATEPPKSSVLDTDLSKYFN